MPPDSDWQYNANSVLPVYSPTYPDNSSGVVPTTSTILTLPTTSATTTNFMYYAQPQLLPMTLEEAPPESNVDWLRRRVSEITDLVAA